MKLLKLLPLLALCLVFLNSCGGSKSTVSSHKNSKSSSRYAVNFENSDKLMPILDQAKAEDKLVFVDVYASWCMPCKMMDRDVFTDRELGRFMNQNFLSVKIDAEKGNGGNIASIYEVYAYPTLLFLDGNGRVLERKEGAAYQTEMRRMAERALAQHNSVGTR